MAYAKKTILENLIYSYPGRRKKLSARFSQFSNFADTAVLPFTVVYWFHALLFASYSQEKYVK